MDDYIKNTLEYYDENSKSYRDEWSNNFTDNFDFKEPSIFISYLKDGAYILDLGCGHGRDTLFFIKNGYRVKAIDGSSEMCKLATEFTGIDVECINFLDIEYNNLFDGVFASASLLHLNNKDLIVVLKKISASLKNNGILMASFKYGEEERLKEKRYFNDMTEEKFRNLCLNIPSLEIIEILTNEGFKEHKSFITFVLRKKVR